MTGREAADRLRPFAVLIMRISILSLFGFMLLSGCSFYQRHPDWDWNSNLPKGAYTKVAPVHRSPDEMDEFFYANANMKNMPLKEVLAHFGRPDGFSPQYINSLTRSSRITTETGGTLRFLLDNDGGEFHVWTPDFSRTGVAVAFSKESRLFHGYRTYLLYNSGAIPAVEKIYGASVYVSRKDREKKQQPY